ncbi:Gfo/Idh/MocA family oxidoreductase [Paenarthrobacter sp. Z7-10]|nr:Gfo/Idh/MocA family oxidoreductase [Paenarthrobacter sp. Z7-10]
MRTAAVIGCGDVSAVHFGAISASPGIELAAVCDPDLDRRSAAVAHHGVAAYEDYETLLDAVHPDVVHICTPHHQHAAMAIAALERGINVILEKPLSHTLAGGKRLVQAAARSSARIGVCFQNRYNAPVQAMASLLGDGGLGAVTGAAGTVMWSRTPAYYLDRPWRGQWSTGGGGLLMNQAIHTLDLLQWLVGEVTEVRGHAGTRALAGVIEVEDTADLSLTHANGARSVFYATLANAVNAPVTLDIYTEKAVLNLRGALTVSYADGRVDVVPEREAVTDGRAYWGASHALLIQDFYRTLDEPGAFWISPSEALKSLRIIKDVYAQSYPAAVPFG